MGKIRAVKPCYRASEIHGLAQRGGGVNVHVRMGDVYALGTADYVVGLEAIESKIRHWYIYYREQLSKKCLYPPLTTSSD